MRTAVIGALVALLMAPLTLAAETPSSVDVTLGEFTVAPATLDAMRDKYVDRVLAEYPEHTWAPLKYELDDEDLAALNLPPADVLRSMDFDRPTMIDRHGRTQVVDLQAAPKDKDGSPGGNGNGNGGGKDKNDGGGDGDGGTTADTAAASFAGAGWFGIRPGALVLLITENSIGWCTLAHVYGSPGAYDISTAGHCGKPGDTATVIAAVGNNTEFVAPILLDFGTFQTSHDNGPGDDWALIDIGAEHQSLVTPTTVFWGGPRGMYTKVGSLVGLSYKGNSLIPEVTVTPDPTLAQGIAHYGHGTGVGGPGGTPRAGTAIAWGTKHFMFEGVISPGDSGSFSNTLTGDAVGDNMEAAGINTHIWVDPLMREGIGIMAGTRATQVSATLANGQYVSYPVPVDGLP